MLSSTRVLALLRSIVLADMATSNLIDRMNSNAQRDSIEFSVLPFHEEALNSIVSLFTDSPNTPAFDFSTATRIDTHTHPIPSWFRALEPQAAGRATPSWNVSAHLNFMSEHKIAQSVLCVSTPQANAFPKDEETLRKKKTVALARLLNEFSAELCRLYPTRFRWLAILPLPYIEETLAEARYALEELKAAGIGVLTNHEGLYPGEPAFDPLWKYLEQRSQGAKKEVVFVHPTEPVIKLDDGRLVSSRPCKPTLPSLSCHSSELLADDVLFLKHHCAPASANSISKLHVQSQASLLRRPSPSFLISSGESPTAQEHSLISQSVFSSASRTLRKKRDSRIKLASGTIPRALFFRNKSRD